MIDETIQSIVDEAFKIAEEEFSEKYPMANPDKDYLILKDSVCTSNAIINLAQYRNDITDAIIHLMIKMERNHLYRMAGEEYDSLKEWAFSKLSEFMSERAIYRLISAALGAFKAEEAGLTQDANQLFGEVGVYKAGMINQAYQGLSMEKAEEIAQEIIESPTVSSAEKVLSEAKFPAKQANIIKFIIHPEEPDGSTRIESFMTEVQLAAFMLKCQGLVEFDFGA